MQKRKIRETPKCSRIFLCLRNARSSQFLKTVLNGTKHSNLLFSLCMVKPCSGIYNPRFYIRKGIMQLFKLHICKLDRTIDKLAVCFKPGYVIASKHSTFPYHFCCFSVLYSITCPKKGTCRAYLGIKQKDFVIRNALLLSAPAILSKI